jgi:hypothetical protein
MLSIHNITSHCMHNFISYILTNYNVLLRSKQIFYNYINKISLHSLNPCCTISPTMFQSSDVYLKSNLQYLFPFEFISLIQLDPT